MPYISSPQKKKKMPKLKKKKKSPNIPKCYKGLELLKLSYTTSEDTTTW